MNISLWITLPCDTCQVKRIPYRVVFLFQTTFYFSNQSTRTLFHFFGFFMNFGNIFNFAVNSEMKRKNIILKVVLALALNLFSVICIVATFYPLLENYKSEFFSDVIF